MSTPTTHISPDCRDGNHSKCDSQAWDLDQDMMVWCECPDCDCYERNGG